MVGVGWYWLGVMIGGGKGLCAMGCFWGGGWEFLAVYGPCWLGWVVFLGWLVVFGLSKVGRSGAALCHDLGTRHLFCCLFLASVSF